MKSFIISVVYNSNLTKLLDYFGAKFQGYKFLISLVKTQNCFGNFSGQLRFLGKCLPTYPSPKSTLTLTSHLGQNVGLGEGSVGSFPET